MAFSSGTFSRLYSWATDLAAGAPTHFITASRVDAELNGMATGLTTCLLKDGSQTVTAHIPMATYRFTGLGVGVARTDSASMVDVQNAGSRHATSGGTNTVTLTLAPASTAYAAGQAYNFKAGGTNTGAATLNVNSLGAKAIQKNLAAVVAGDITQNDIVEVVYDGTQFQMISPARTPVLTADGIAGASVAIATASTRGTCEFATDAETITGTSTVLAVTPANVEAKVASATAKGVVELATNAEVITGTDTTRAITAGGLHAALAGLTDTTITTADTIVFADATDSAALKEDTVQGILDLFAATDDVLTGGFGGTDDDDGTKSSGTYTPTYAGGNFKLAVNGGAHTLAPQSGTGTIIIQYTNDGSAGTITTSGWTIVTGDSLTTTSGHDFMFYLTVVAAFKHLHITALQ
jgi:hypothetical protein